jgi:hypothetical protein
MGSFRKQLVHATCAPGEQSALIIPSLVWVCRGRMELRKEEKCYDNVFVAIHKHSDNIATIH